MNGQATTMPASLSPLPKGEGQGEGNPNARFSGGDPIPKFAEPHLILDTPDDRLNSTPASLVQYAAGNLTHLTQGHRHDVSQYTHSQISGQATSIFAQQGGLQFIAANGPVSLQAHAGELSALSQQALTITSTNGEIEIKAPSQITLIAGDTKIELSGANVTLSTSGELNLKGTLKQVAKGLSGGTSLPVLPQGVVSVPKQQDIPSMAIEYDEAFVLLNEQTGEPLRHYPYEIKRADGRIERGTTDGQGQTHLVNADTSESISIEIVEDVAR
jgi:type VI secretion system secreted protein VgrG